MEGGRWKVASGKKSLGKLGVALTVPVISSGSMSNPQQVFISIAVFSSFPSIHPPPSAATTMTVHVIQHPP